jgi:2'-5' RNA ligase
VTTNAFVAVDLDDADRHDLAAALTEASPGPPLPGKRTPPENWHITLRFLGPVDDVLLDRLTHALESSLDVGGGHVACTGLGAFPRASKAAVAYAAIEDDGLLAGLAANCEDVCRDLGLEPEERPFVPHLTLARIRPPVDLRRRFEAFGEFRVRIAVRGVSVMRTVPRRGGVQYRTVAMLPLGHTTT